MPLYLNPVLKKYYKYGTEPNVTVVGSPTIENGVASGFSSTSWLVLPENFSPNSNSWDMVAKFNLSALGAERGLFNSSSVAYQPIDIVVTKENKLYFGAYVNNTSTLLFNVTGTTTLEVNKDYYVKASYNPKTGYELSLSTDGITYTPEASSSVTTPITSGYNVVIGADFQAGGKYYASAFTNGSIDLKKSYIKINGEEWWRGTKGIESTADDYDYIVTVPPKPIKDLHLGSQKIALGLLNNELVYCSYNATQTICDVSNGETWSGTLARGVYYIRAQGAGGGGGNNNYSNNGGGGGSGAGFEGYINLTSPIETTVTTGAGGANSSAGADTVISDVMTLGGGKGGGSGVAGAGGTLTLSESGLTILKSTIQSNGEDGNFSNAGSGSRCYGGNSVLTGDGGGDGSKAATKPGAGGGGQIQFGSAGQPGMYGECLIKLVGVY